MCTEDLPCEICKDWLPEVWQAQEKANEQKRRRKAAKAAKKSQERDTMDDSVEIHTPEEVLQLPTKRKRDGSSMTKRAKTATGSGSGSLPGPVSPRSPWLPACLWWDGPGPTVVLGPRGRSPQITKWGPTDARTPQGPIILLDTSSGREEGERA